MLPGYGDERYFAANNRVKSARLSIHSVGMYPAQVGIQYVFKNTGLVYDVEFQDVMELQEITVDLSASGSEVGRYLYRENSVPLTNRILATYTGLVYGNVCPRARLAN